MISLFCSLLVAGGPQTYCIADSSQVSIVREHGEGYSLITRKNLNYKDKEAVVAATWTKQAYFVLLSSPNRQSFQVARYNLRNKTWKQVPLAGTAGDFSTLSTVDNQCLVIGKKFATISESLKFSKPVDLTLDSTFTRVNQNNRSEVWVTNATGFKEAMVNIRLTRIRSSAGTLTRSTFDLMDMPLWAGSYRGKPTYTDGINIYCYNSKEWETFPLASRKNDIISEIHIGSTGSVVVVGRENVMWQKSLNESLGSKLFAHDGKQVSVQMFGQECILINHTGTWAEIYKLNMTSGVLEKSTLKVGSEPPTFVTALDG
ncbi:MAG: hypothetical protein JNJ45_10165 [Chthonomonas sp.]|nr:hypothetical protein [Chthonomonas sp.]